MINLMQSATGELGFAVAESIAVDACRDARGAKPGRWDRLPKWWEPRARRVLGRWGFQNYWPEWIDHPGVVVDQINGESVRCFVSEPFPWFDLSHNVTAACKVWPHVVGDFAHCVPANGLRDAAHLAGMTGCNLVIERIAWHSPHCFRLTFRAVDWKTPIAAWRRMYPKVKKLIEYA